MQTILAAVAQPEERAQPVIERAAQLALSFGAKLVLFHSQYDADLAPSLLYDARKLARARGRAVARSTLALERAADAQRRRGLAVDVIVVWEDPAHEAVIRAAIRDRVDLIVAGPHANLPKRGRFRLGQTDWQLLRLAPQSVLLVRSSDAPTGPVLAALDPTHSHDKPAHLDGQLALAGREMAQALDADFEVVHCYLPDPTAGKAATDRRRRTLHQQLKATLKNAAVKADHMHLVAGRTERSLPAFTKKRRARMLVMGAISRRGIKRLLIGNTAEKVIDAVDCDLLIVKPKGFKTQIARKVKREAVER